MAIYAAIAAGKLQPELQFGLSIRSLALLSAPSTPKTVVDEVVEQAKAGGKVAHSRVRETVDDTGAPPSSGPRAASSRRTSPS